LHAAAKRFAKMKPRTAAGAAALVTYFAAQSDNEMSVPEKWHYQSLFQVAAALKEMPKPPGVERAKYFAPGAPCPWDKECPARLLSETNPARRSALQGSA
jgi:hypothetical protein